MSRLVLIVCALLPLVASAADGKRIAITIDDLPVVGTTPIAPAEKVHITTRILDALRAHDALAVGFVNEDKLLEAGGIDANVALLQAWLDAGMELGNHTYGHVGMHDTELATMQAAVIQGETVSRWLSARAGRPYRYFRHPYTRTGDSPEDKAAFEAFLASRGYTVAPFTIEDDDYLYSCAYERLDSTAERDAVAAAYLAHVGDAIDAYETMSDELFGRQVPQIWLIHANRLHAATLATSLAMFAERGYEFVTLEQALEDPAYDLATAPSGRYGPSWLIRWARTLDKKLSVYGQPEPTVRCRG